MRLVSTIGINWFDYFECKTAIIRVLWELTIASVICGNFLWLQAMVRGEINVAARSTMQVER